MVFLSCIVCAMTAGVAAVCVSLVLFGVRVWSRVRGKNAGDCSCEHCRSREKNSAGTQESAAAEEDA